MQFGILGAVGALSLDSQYIPRATISGSKLDLAKSKLDLAKLNLA